MKWKVVYGICLVGETGIVIFLALAGVFGSIIPSWVMKLYGLFLIIQWVLLFRELKKRKVKNSKI